MSTMGKAAVAHAFNAPLIIEEMEFRDPQPGEVLVKMEATGICHTDLHAIAGDWPIKPALPFVPGHEGVGIVAKTGSSVAHVREGDRVGLPWLHSACGVCEWCLTGWESLCPLAVYGGYTANGSFAEYSLAPAAFAAPVPASLTAVAAAPILCAGVTTWKALKEAELEAGDWVAISGIGGLGHLAMQYAKAMGLRIVAVDVADDKLALARRIGADLVIDARTQSPADTVQKETGGAHGVIITAPSREAFAQGLGMTRRKGTCVLVGLPPGDFPVPIFDVVLKRITIRGSLVGTREDIAEAMSFVSRGLVKCASEERPFSEVNASLDDLRGGKVDGRIVLTFP